MKKRKRKRFSSDGFLQICTPCDGTGEIRRFYEPASGGVYEIAGTFAPTGARLQIECCSDCKGSGVRWRYPNQKRRSA